MKCSVFLWFSRSKWLSSQEQKLGQVHITLDSYPKIKLKFLVLSKFRNHVYYRSHFWWRWKIRDLSSSFFVFGRVLAKPESISDVTEFISQYYIDKNKNMCKLISKYSYKINTSEQWENLTTSYQIAGNKNSKPIHSDMALPLAFTFFVSCYQDFCS